MNPTNKRWPKLEYWLNCGHLDKAFKGEIERTRRDYPPPPWATIEPYDIGTVIVFTLFPEGLEDLSRDPASHVLFASTWGKAPAFFSALSLAVLGRWNSAKGRKQIACRVWLINRMPFLRSDTSDDQLAGMAAEETGLEILTSDIRTARKAL